ncbi:MULTISPECIES: FecCD family ABC transporter permease [unclassified Nocardioides]|uniref:FecCD family ABC transporter permease n=1 Tax=unclassified Nocardioides TaxID=2615069 RepID=UPI00301431C8
MTSTASPPTTRPSVPDHRRGSVVGLLVLVVLVVVAALVSLAVGSRSIPFGTVVDVLFHEDGSDASTIVHDLRLPRTLLGLAVGACLGIAGALMQGHTRNPLAEPGLLGVNAGAAFAVVLGIYGFSIGGSGYVWFALVGAGLASAAVFAIGSSKGGPNPVTLVLAGAAVTALLEAATQSVVLNDRATLLEYRFWVVGSVAGRPMDVLWDVLPFMAAGLLLAAIGATGLNMLQLGDDVARSLGMTPWVHKTMGVAAVMLLAGAATAACGPIAFLGLVVPHIARVFSGVDYRWLLPYSGLVGAVFLVVADVVGRVVVRPGELQVGIVMALVGGPVFMLIVRRMRLVRL